MKTEMIDRLVAPYVKNQQLTYDDFDKIFGSALTHKEEYKIVDYLDSKGIELVDELPENADNDSLDGMDSILELDDQQDDEPDSASDDSKEEELVVYNKNVRQKNSTLCMMIQQGNKQAVQDLCVKNQKLVIKYAYEYSKRTKFLTIDDLAQFGYFGLMRAAQGYDPAKGTSFSTYAVIWIKQAIRRAIADEETTVRMPVHMCETIYKVEKYDNQFAREGIENLSQRVRMIAEACEMTEEKVIETMMYRQQYMQSVSLDCPIGEDHNSFLGDYVVDEKAPSVEDTAAEDFLKEQLPKILSTLKPREEQVIRLHFGLDDGRAETLQEIGDKFGVSRERIRQIEEKALRRLRHPSRSRQLREYLD
ncbi:RNA polymerase sigma factor RpoD/SigA [uncultured Mitsuokella sp.]|uniref:sigma-70 family RNA polymerase sigma factor n=1 Tax=uncultured Mitsuokella sp. TaxID=453120 RepID=UPI0025DCDA1D|nr:sigma-70 family RNA polymerase sigma factor [uncultured Mitsuokella sp.]